MNLSNKIKELRGRDGFSQEALAERIYVTRQTVSNWETGRSYPDVQSLLMLGVLFDVSLDELVKGDIDMMRNELDVYKMKMWSGIMIVLSVLAVVSTIPLLMAFDWAGLILPLGLFAVAFTASIAIERIKKKHNVQTYSEIVAFVEGKENSSETIPWGRRHKGLAMGVKFLGGAAVGLVLSGLGFLLWKFISGQ